MWMTRYRGPDAHFRRSFLSFVYTCFYLALAAICPFVRAADARSRAFNLPADHADKSLQRFAAQAGAEVMFATAAVAGIRTNPVVGEFSPREALNRLIADKPLMVVEESKSGTFVVARRAAPKPSNSPTPASPPSSSNKPMQSNRILSWLAGALALGAGATSASGQTTAAGNAASATAATSE